MSRDGRERLRQRVFSRLSERDVEDVEKRRERRDARKLCRGYPGVLERRRVPQPSGIEVLPRAADVEADADDGPAFAFVVRSRLDEDAAELPAVHEEVVRPLEPHVEGERPGKT